MKLPISWLAAGAESAGDDFIAFSTVNGHRLGICMSAPLEIVLRPSEARADTSTRESVKRELLFSMVISCTTINKNFNVVALKGHHHRNQRKCL